MARLWLRWVLANVVGEVVGFGLAAAGVAISAQVIPTLGGALQIAGAAAAIVTIGSVEGGAVGLAQWTVLRDALPRVSARSWIGATLTGAIVAWAVGMAIGTVAGERLAESAAASPLAGAAVVGLAAGAMLSIPQALVLRRIVEGAAWWVAANAAAWVLGMVIAFVGMDRISADAALPLVVAAGAAIGLAMGALVASCTGVALVALVRATPSRV